MTFAALVFVYLLGGLTFLPLLLAALLIPAWRLLPLQEHDDGRLSHPATHDELGAAGPADEIKAAQVDRHTPDGAASGTFAVLRSHNFQSANAALTGRAHNAAAAASAATADGPADAGAATESVYQSMYRTVFDRNKNAANTRSVLQQRDNAPAATHDRKRKNAVPANIFFIVVRHGHLMLYDSQAQMEVRHVISLAHHTVSISEGGPPQEDYERLKDGDLFIKRSAIVLTPLDLPNGQLQANTPSPTPFYLFSANCCEKEDFYHALLYTRSHPPSPIPLDPNDAIKLQSALHSTSLTQETRAFNALIGRIFLALYRTDSVKDLIQRKIEKKISRVQKPAFIAGLAVHSIDLGDASPMLSNPKLKDLNVSGDVTVAFDVRYDGGVKSDGIKRGGIKLTISALAKLDLGPRFKVRTVDLLLATSLQRLHGRMLVRIKPPPSNRIWFTFETMPEMDIKVEPIVSQRQITYTFILRAIEERIRAVVGETLVHPNWDDAPFFDTRGQKVRGGIWADEGGEPDAQADSDSIRSIKVEKAMSMPTLVGEADSSSASSGSEATSKLASGSSIAGRETSGGVKRRSLATPPDRAPSIPSLTSQGDQTPPPPKPLRSPSFTNPAVSAASVAVDGANAEQVRASGIAKPPPRKWRSRPTATPPRREAVEAMREMRDRSQPVRDETQGASADVADIHKREDANARPARASPDIDDEADYDADATPAFVQNSSRSSSSSKIPSVFSTASPNHPSHMYNRADTDLSTASSASSRQNEQQRKTILAATAAATNAARNWSWNAISKTRSPHLRGPSVGSNPGSTASNAPPAEPMGRGQPLPPPGIPLPRPQQKGIFGGTGVMGGLGSVKRKPVPASTHGSSATTSRRSSGTGSLGVETGDSRSVENLVDVREEPRPDRSTPAKVGAGSPVGDEFGPWNENSGVPSDSDAELAVPPEPTSGAAPEPLRSEERDHEDILLSERPPAKPGASKIPPALPARRVPPPLPARGRTLASDDVPLDPSPADQNPKASVDSAAELDPRADNSTTTLKIPTEPANNGRDDTAVLLMPESDAVHPDASEAAPAITEAADIGLEADAKFLHGEPVAEEDFERTAPGQELGEDEVEDEDSLIAIPAPHVEDHADGVDVNGFTMDEGGRGFSSSRHDGDGRDTDLVQGERKSR